MVGEKATQSPVLDNWSGCNIQLDPGAYRLRVQAGSVGRLEQIVVTSLSWQTQVFLLRREYGGDSPPVRRADLGNASVLMLRIGQGFHSKEAHLRQTELARHGLAHGRVVMQPDELNKMLWMKSDNPMLGIYGAHLLLLSQEPDRNLLRTVTANL